MEPTLPGARDHANAGCVESALPNWSRPVAVNCCVLGSGVPSVRVGPGDTVIDVSVWLTVTVMELVADWSSGPAIVAVNVYDPAWVMVAVVFDAAFVPFAE